MDTVQCSACSSHEAYHSRHRWRERCMKWLHPGSRLYHCHMCGLVFWTNQKQNSNDIPIELSNATDRHDPAKPATANAMYVMCPSCGTLKTGFGRLWDDLWTSFRGHNKLYNCRKCKTMFSPPG